MKKIEIAAMVLQGICAGDWKFDIKDQTWDDVATERALQIAEKLLDKYHGYDDSQSH